MGRIVEEQIIALLIKEIPDQFKCSEIDKLSSNLAGCIINVEQAHGTDQTKNTRKQSRLKVNSTCTGNQRDSENCNHIYYNKSLPCQNA